MATPPPSPWSLSTPLFGLTDHPADAITLTDAFQHFLVLGQTGSGKSSTTARILLASMARLGFGGYRLRLVRTAKGWRIQHLQSQSAFMTPYGQSWVK